nr:ShlB/FhaC/HecB family hemolysin secretion/activation protein [uncultured Lacibacter sp.]
MLQIRSAFYHSLFVAACCWLFVLPLQAQEKYQLQYRFADTVDVSSSLGLQKEFSDKVACSQYIFELPKLLQKKGYITASVDSVKMDSATAEVLLFLGQTYRWALLNTSAIPQDLLDAVGYRDKNFKQQPLDFAAVQVLQTRLLDKLENTGYPFANVYLDSIDLQQDAVSAILKINEGPLYKIDSIRVYGDVKISNRFLQRYLEIKEGSIYQKEKLLNISPRLLQLPYILEENKWNMSFLGAGSIVNLYLKERKSSQINGIIGFLPANDQLGGNKLLVTGDFNLNLKNGFGLGEALSVVFQQIQVQSPRLQMGYQQPFLFGSPFGVDLSFDGFKKDSSFLNINMQFGVQYAFGGNRSGKIFYQQFISNLLNVDTIAIRNSKRLPDQVDQTTSNIGLEYEWFTTDYRFNPRKGFDFKITGSAGIRRIRPNNNIAQLKDPANPGFDYQSLYDSVGLRAYTFRLKLNAAKYFKTGKQTAFKTAFNGGLIQSPRIFRNELYQLGGFKMLRGFDEESIFASAYAVLTAEYRILTGLNSFIYAFTDGGWVRNNSQFANSSNLFIGSGLGLAFETKAGIFNVAFAAGKRNDLPMNLRQSKIHFGYVNFF